PSLVPSTLARWPADFVWFGRTHRSAGGPSLTNRRLTPLALSAVIALASALASPAPSLAAAPRGPDVPAVGRDTMVATDMAAAAGIAQITRTWSAPVGDFNGDGWQ